MNTIELIIELRETGKDVLNHYKCDGLKDLCSDLGLSKTGKKSVLVNRIWEKVVTESDKIFGNDYFIGYHDVIGYLFIHEYQKILSRAICRKIASNPKNQSMSACLQIVNNHYQEEIFKDICQDMAMTLMDMAKNHEVCIKNGRVWCVSADFSESTYIKLYNSVYNTLQAYGQNYSQKNKIVGNTAITYDDNGNEHIISEKSTHYINALSNCTELLDCEFNSSLIDFFKFMGEKYGLKRAKDCSLYVAGRLDGLTIDDISEKYDIPRRTLIRRIELLKVAYNEYKNNYSMFTEHNTKSATFGGYQKNQITNNGFKYGDIFESELNKPIVINDFMKRPKVEESKLITVRESKDALATYYKYFTYSSDKQKRLENHRFARAMAYKTGTLHKIRAFQFLEDRTMII